MKKIIYFLSLSAILTSCASSCVKTSTTTVSESQKTDSVAFYRNQVDSLKLEILDLNDQLDVAQDVLQMREGEISYWGHKLDSCMAILTKSKKK